MKKLSLVFVVLFIANSYGFSQTKALEVFNKQIKISADNYKEFYFGFAEGDKITLSISEINNIEIGKVEVIEYPSKPILNQAKIKVIDKLELKVNEKAIYNFRISNDKNTEITCNFKILRVPASAKTEDFNTNIVWVEKQDTIRNANKTVASSDTTITKSKVKKLVKTEQIEEILLDKTVILDAIGSKDNADKSIMTLEMPKLIDTKTESTEITRWTYWIGAGSESDDAFNENVNKFKELKSSFTSPLAGYATGLINELKIPAKGNIVEYWIMKDNVQTQAFLDNKEFAYLDNGKGVANYGKSSVKKGPLYFAIRNNSKTKDLKVFVKVVGIAEKSTYEFQEKHNMIIKDGNEKPPMQVKTIKVPTFAE